MNDTKWDELRLSMNGLGYLSPKWRTLDVENDCLSTWDGDWFYHFRTGEYKTIRCVEIAINSVEQRHTVQKILEKIHVPGKATEVGFRVFGHIEIGQSVEYLSDSNLLCDSNASRRSI